MAEARFRAALESIRKRRRFRRRDLDEAAKLPERVAELEAERESLMARIAELEDELSELSGLTAGSSKAGWMACDTCWRGRSDREPEAAVWARAGAPKETSMPLVNVMVNGRAYTTACDDGEEDHLKELAAHVDAKARGAGLGRPGAISACC